MRKGWGVGMPREWWVGGPGETWGWLLELKGKSHSLYRKCGAIQRFQPNKRVTRLTLLRGKGQKLLAETDWDPSHIKRRARGSRVCSQSCCIVKGPTPGKQGWSCSLHTGVVARFRGERLSTLVFLTWRTQLEHGGLVKVKSRKFSNRLCVGGHRVHRCRGHVLGLAKPGSVSWLHSSLCSWQQGSHLSASYCVRRQWYLMPGLLCALNEQ